MKDGHVANSGGATDETNETNDTSDTNDLNDTSESVGERLDRFFPTAEGRLLAARALAAEVQRAHALRADGWALTQPQEGRIRVVVGTVRAFDLVPAKARFAVDLTGVDEQTLVSLKPRLLQESEFRVPKMGDNTLYEVPIDEAATLPPRVLGMHEAYLKAAATGPSSVARFHDEALLERIRSLTGLALPSPARVLRLAKSVDEVRAAIGAFAADVKTGAAKVKGWAFQHPTYWAYDEETGAFAPSKFAAFAGMDPDWYLRLQQERPTGFEGTRAWKQVAKLTGRSPVEDPPLVEQLKSFMRTSDGQVPFVKDVKFIRVASPIAAADRGQGAMPNEAPPQVASKPPKPPAPLPRNRILYGPPGTGKTFKTAELAVEICDGEVPPDRAALMERYRELQEEGRIAFVTFHQSYSYEDFVEGIRPQLDGEGEGRVSYECRPGVFLRLCEAAQAGQGVSGTGPSNIDISEVRVWKMSLTNEPDSPSRFEDAMRRGEILLGWGQGLDFSACRTRDDVLQKLAERGEVKTFEATEVQLFKNVMQKGDLVVVSEGNTRFRAIGLVTGDYLPPLEEGSGASVIDQRRSVQWLARFSPSLPVSQILNSKFQQQTLYELGDHVLKAAALEGLLSGEPGEPQPHVLVIDEINRGNVSKVFGELITLLEPDKRLGAANELTVTLPYSGESFGVPSHVHVIGTMNTADRSIALLDTALRRRFEFIELMPDVEAVEEVVGSFSGVSVAEVLDVLNQRIELLYDREHTIGHAFFLSVRNLDDLRDVFLQKVIPLLQEYFYGDVEKLCLVLGCAFDPDTGRRKNTKAKAILEPRLLSPAALFDDADVEAKVCVAVSSEFLQSQGAALAPFFASFRRPQRLRAVIESSPSSSAAPNEPADQG